MCNNVDTNSIIWTSNISHMVSEFRALVRNFQGRKLNQTGHASISSDCQGWFVSISISVVWKQTPSAVWKQTPPLAPSLSDDKNPVRPMWKKHLTRQSEMRLFRQRSDHTPVHELCSGHFATVLLFLVGSTLQSEVTHTIISWFQPIFGNPI